MEKQQRQRIANYLGLARKAGKIMAGDALTREALLKGRAALVVIALDAAPKVREELTALAGTAIPVLYWPDKEDLGRIVGTSRRGALALLDEGFAKAIMKIGIDRE